MKRAYKRKVPRITHNDRILSYLRENGHITSWEAIKEFGITRLSAVIFNLRNAGYNIVSERESNTNRYGDMVSFAKYVLVA